MSIVPTSLDSENVNVVFDSGNEGPTIFPRRLLPFASNVKQVYAKISCAGRADNFVETSHSGEITFLAPTDGGTTTKIDLQGYFMSEADSFHDEVLISRHDMPLAPGLNEGKNFAVTGRLRKYPDTLFGLDEDLKQAWKVCPPQSRALRRIRGNDMVWTDEKAIEDWSDEFEFDLGEMKEHLSAKHMVWKIHNRLGHPSIDAFQASLKTLGLLIGKGMLKEVYMSCAVCRTKPKGAKPIRGVPKADKNHTGLAVMDLTEPTVLGNGGFRYMSVIVDADTGYVSVFNCRKKIEAAIHLSNFLDANPHIKSVRVDGGGELNSEQV